MFQFVGYNFFADMDALNSAPSTVDNIKTTTISNAIFDHVNVTKNTKLPYGTTIPTEWDYDTILDADFDNNINAGNVDFLINSISAVKIKRRVKGNFDWLTLKTIPVSKVEDLNFVFNDFLNGYGVDYEYALVPVINDIEGNYLINSVHSVFNGVFIGDAEQTFKFLYNVEYGTNSRNQQIGTFEPLGKKYPVIIANGLLSYESGSVSATILNDDYEETGKVDSLAIVEKKTIIKDFLTNKRAKLLKDWAGNTWLCMVMDNVQVSYKTGSGLKIPQVQFNWVQIGDAESQNDLYTNGVIDEKG